MESANKYKLVPLDNLPEGTKLLPNEEEFTKEKIFSRSTSRASSISSSSEINAIYKSDPNNSRMRLPGAHSSFSHNTSPSPSQMIKKEPFYTDVKLQLHKGNFKLLLL